MLLNSIPLQQILDIGVTRKGSIYLTYVTEKGKGCSFVSFGELRTALNVDGVHARILAELARDRISDLLAYNRSHFPQQELDEHLEQQAAEVAPEYIFLQRQIEKAVADLNLTAQFIEDEGELFARIYADQFLGIINVDAFGKITVFSDRFKGKRVWSVAGAMSLIANNYITKPISSNDEIAAQNLRFLQSGVILKPDGTIELDRRFYQKVGRASQLSWRR